MGFGCWEYTLEAEAFLDAFSIQSVFTDDPLRPSSSVQIVGDTACSQV